MDVDILEVTSRSIVLKAPLNTNINYEGTAFGGSLNTLCVLSAYLLVHHILVSHAVEFDSLVIQDSSINYISPVEGDFMATAEVSDFDISRFLKMLERRGKGRLELAASIAQVDDSSKEHKVKFQGRYVVSQ